MPAPAAQIVASGTPVTNQLGVGAVAGNAITMAGLTLAPSQPGWQLVSSQGGPGAVSGTWQFGTTAKSGELPVQGAFYRSAGGAGSGDGGGGDSNEGFTTDESPGGSVRLSKTGWVLLGILVTLILTDKSK